MLKFLLLLHTAAAIVCLGTITHNLVMVVSYWRGQFRRPQLEKLVCQGQLHRLPLYLRSRWGGVISFLSLSSAPPLLRSILTLGNGVI